MTDKHENHRELFVLCSLCSPLKIYYYNIDKLKQSIRTTQRTVDIARTKLSYTYFSAGH
jgi:hypothetical protein